jgi:hypothetical protein
MFIEANCLHVVGAFLSERGQLLDCVLGVAVVPGYAIVVKEGE